MTRAVTAGVVGQPIRHSLSPLLHNAWLAALGRDEAYAAFEAPADGFAAMVARLRNEGLRGVNVTLPFKVEALALATLATERAQAAGAANVLVFAPDGRVLADNTDGEGLMAAFAEQAPDFDPKAGPIVILGAGGAARGAAATLAAAGAPEVRIVNRTPEKAQALADILGGPVAAWSGREAFEGATCVVNATSGGLAGGDALFAPLEAAAPGAVVMDMVYTPLVTPLLAEAQRLGRPTVDGLAMLIGQARPAFAAFFGQPTPDIDVRALALAELSRRAA